MAQKTVGVMPDSVAAALRAGHIRIGELADLVEASVLGMNALVQLPAEIESGIEVTESGATGWPGVNEDLDEARRLAGIAKRQEKRGFKDLYAQAVIALWANLDLAMDEFFTDWLDTFPEVAETPPLQDLKIQLTVPEALNRVDRGNVILGSVRQALQRKTPAEKWAGAGRYEVMLKALAIPGLGLVLKESMGKKKIVPHVGLRDKGTLQDLTELWAVRNVIVHEGGRASSYLARVCPWRGVSLGQEVSVTRDDFERYARSAGYYLAYIAGLSSATAVMAQESSS